jgi:hypothetical protein
MPGARRFSVIWTLSGADPRVTSWHFVVPGDLDHEDDVEAAFDTAWGLLADRYGANVTLSEYRWYFASDPVIPPADWGDADRIIDRNATGAQLTGTLPPQCAIVVSYPRGAPLHRHPGRNFMPAPSPDQNTTEGRLTSAATTEFADAISGFLQACIDVGYHPYTLLRGASLPEPLVATIDRVRVDDRIDTQRRRAHEGGVVIVNRDLDYEP